VLTTIFLPRLWRRGRTPWEQLVHDFGVRRVGLWGGGFFSVVFPYLRPEGEHSLSIFALQASVCFLVGLPLWLWAGYWWGRTMAALFKVGWTIETDGGR
jgi:hypothetical protein